MTKRRGDPVPARHIGPTAVAVEEFLRGLRCAEIKFSKTKHVHVEFFIGPRRQKVSLPCTPRDDDNATYNAVRRIKRIVECVCAGVPPPR